MKKNSKDMSIVDKVYGNNGKSLGVRKSIIQNKLKGR